MSAPRQIGPYRIEAELARGGQGVVFRGRGPHGPVAVKLLFDLDPRSLRRFQQEAAVALRVAHPNALRGIELGVHGGRPYLVSELIEGEDLERRVWRDGTPPVERARRWLAAVGAGVHHCHQLGLIHRDLKPANVLVERETGRPVIVDYGLVAADRRDFGELTLAEFSRLSESGEINGTPAYMAPEQADPAFGEVGPHTDVYAMGGILYFLITGEAPYRGKDALHVLNKLVDPTYPEPDLAQLAPDAPPDLIELCAASLSRDPTRRPASALAFARAVRGQLPPESGDDRRRGLPLWGWLLTGALAVGAGLGLRGLTRPTPSTVELPAPSGPTEVQDRVAELCARGEQELAADRPAVALDWAAQAERLLPGSSEVLLLRARAYEQLARREQALEALGSLLAADPDHVEALNLRSKLLRDADRLPEAEADLLHALELAPQNTDLLRRHGLLLMRLGRPRDAQARFQAIVDTGDTRPWDFENLALCQLEAGERERGRESLRQGARAHPEERASMRLVWADALVTKADYTSACETLDLLLAQDPDYAPALERRCELRLFQGKLDVALEDAEAYRALAAPWQGASLMGRAWFLAHHPTRAIPELRAAFDAAPDADRSARALLQIYLALALLLERDGVAARGALRRAAELTPQDPWADLWLACSGLDRDPLARRAPDDRPWVARLCRAVVERDLEAWDEIQPLCPELKDESIALGFLGLLAESEGDLDAAQQLYGHAMAANGTRSVPFVWAIVRGRALRAR